MSATPYISVILPVYNANKIKRECIRSILEQTFTDFEFIVIKKASDDKSSRLVKAFRDKRVKLLSKSSNIYESFNKGIFASQGRYICFMASEDISQPERFEREVNFMEQNPEFGLAGSGYRVIGQEKDLFPETDYEKIKVQLLRNSSFVHSSVIINSKLLKKQNLQFAVKYKISSYYDFFVRAARFFPVTNMNEVLMYCGEPQDQLLMEQRSKPIKLYYEISINQLHYLGLIPDLEERMLHLQLLNGKFINNIYKNRLYCWINKIKDANKKVGFYDKTELDNFLDSLFSMQPFCRKIGSPFSISKTSLNRKRSNEIAKNEVRKKLTIEVLTLLSGNTVYFKQWNQGLMKLRFDYPVRLRILDNSGEPAFHKMLERNIPVWKKKFNDVSVVSYLEPYKPFDPDNYLEKGRHTHVADLYSKLFSQVTGDFVLTFEEDIIPEPDTFRSMVSKFKNNSVGALGCAYTSPKDKNLVCAAFGLRRWGTPIPWQSIKGQLIPVDYIGGGFTLWNLSRLNSKVITHDWNRSLGWDAVLCERIRSTGLRILLAGDLICQHNNRYIKSI